MTTTHNTTDVLVIGAGPTGLTAAAELRRHGVRVLVVESADTDAPETPPYAVLHARTLELLAIHGVTPELDRAGERVHVLHLATDPGHTADVALGRLDSAYPYALRVPWEDLTGILAASLDEPVLSGCRVTSISEDALGAAVTLEGFTAPIVVRAQYVVDCSDGTLAASLGVTERHGEPADADPFAPFGPATVLTPRLLDLYRAGRVFFAGPAAHRFAPTAGIDVNLGIQDAVNLAWKLAYVRRGLASDSLLHTYHAERRPVGEAVLRSTEWLHGVLRKRLPVVGRALGRGLRGLLGVTTVQDRLAAMCSQLGLNYRRTPFSRSHREHGARAAGDRVPDLLMASMADPDTRLYDLLRTSGYALMACAATRPAADRAMDLLGQVRSAYAGLIHPMLLLSEGLPADGEVPTMVDARHQFRNRMRVQDGDLLLIRPDGYLAFQLPGTETALLPNLLGAWVVTRALTPALTPTHSVLG